MSLSPQSQDADALAEAGAWLHRGNALMDLDRLDEAIVSFDRALSLTPDSIEALTNRSDALSNLHRFEEAVVGYEQVLGLRPEFAYIWANQGIALAALLQVLFNQFNGKACFVQINISFNGIEYNFLAVVLSIHLYGLFKKMCRLNTIPDLKTRI